MKAIFTFILSLTLITPLFAQNADSLESLLTPDLEGSEKKDILIQLCEIYRLSNPNAMRLYAEELLATAEDENSNGYAWGQYYLGVHHYYTDNFKKTENHFLTALRIFEARENSVGSMKAAGSLGNIYFFRDEYDNALKYAKEALNFAYQVRDKEEQSNMLALICDIYSYMEHYNLAIENCVKSLKIRDEIELTKGKEIVLNSIGLIYQELGTDEKAEKYLFQALEVAEENEVPYNLATTHSNIGNYFLSRGKTEKALESFKKAMRIDSISQDEVGLAYSYFDIAKIYLKKEENDKALSLLKKSKKLGQEQEMPELLARIGLEIGEVYISQSQYPKAVQELKNSVTIAQKINSTGILKDTYQKISKLYDKMGDKNNALIYMKLFMLENERRYKEENIRSIAEIETLYNIEKKEKEIDLLKKDNAIQELRAEKRTFYITALVVGVLLLLIVLLVLYNRNKLKSKTNKALNQQNLAILEQKEEIETQKEELAATGNKLAYKNQQITDSIIYAKQIQDSLLPQLPNVQAQFPESFIFFKPKDIVSGDFYWFAAIEDKIAIALVDCTGHGVPGAFMTVLANSLLNQIVIETGITSPDLIVSLLDQKIQQNLHQERFEKPNTDGLDVSLIMIDEKNKKFEFTGAKIPIYLHQDNELKIIEPDRDSVGSALIKDKSFTKQEIPYKSGDTIYMSSDGFQDQFGGSNNKKFMKSKFRTLLSKITEKPIHEQESYLEKEFLKWKGNNYQTDDVLVIGFKLK